MGICGGAPMMRTGILFDEEVKKRTPEQIFKIFREEREWDLDGCEKWMIPSAFASDILGVGSYNSDVLNEDSTQFLFLSDSGFHVLNFNGSELKYSHPVHCEFLGGFKNLVNKIFPKKHGARWMVSNDKLFKFEINNQSDILNNRPTSVPTQCLQYFIKDKNKLISKFAHNDLSDGWTPIAPVYVHHGTEDENVFYPFNTETTVNNLNKLGGNVVLVKYEGHDHYTLDKLYLLNMIDEFNQYL